MGKDKILVFGIFERRGKRKVEVVKDVSTETLLKEIIKKVKRGSIIYTDRWKGYDTLVIYGFKVIYVFKHLRITKILA